MQSFKLCMGVLHILREGFKKWLCSYKGYTYFGISSIYPPFTGWVKGVLAYGQGLGTGESSRSVLIQTILWFYDNGFLCTTGTKTMIIFVLIILFHRNVGTIMEETVWRSLFVDTVIINTISALLYRMLHNSISRVWHLNLSFLQQHSKFLTWLFVWYYLNFQSKIY